MIPGAVVARVAKRNDVPLVVAQDLAARAVLGAAIKVERRHHDLDQSRSRGDRFPRLERRRNQLALLEALIEKEDR